MGTDGGGGLPGGLMPGGAESVGDESRLETVSETKAPGMEKDGQKLKTKSVSEMPTER
ncbi:hypothetical protein GPL15_25050 [Clostridium sp. MCC353]|uniref:hypothetical protein n=1 Tax=Clostridium sp. MCC353 TaxID=2592646 RepID=UPI001C00A163|nr:hypothetical protein [Clostridium sp. MCC353]MBT9779744.1 hypothetical protein [Clostridium sp. MCC353]